MENLNGPFKDIIPMFQKYKKSIGYKYDNIYNYTYLDKKLYTKNITNFSNSKEIFNILVTEENDIQKQKRNYYALKELYAFMNINGYTNLYFEERYFQHENNPTTPLSENEINILFKVIDQYCIENNDKLLPVLFRLIYSCGLRISEAINLKIVDFNRENATLLIIKSKNNITRLVTLSNTMLDTLDTYFKVNDLSKNTYLFEIKKRKMSKKYIEDKFKMFTTVMGLNSRIHALRFSFAVHTLDNLYKNKINSKEVLYPLSVYMGHKDIESTEYYLQFTVEYQKKYVTSIIPKGGN